MPLDDRFSPGFNTLLSHPIYPYPPAPLSCFQAYVFSKTTAPSARFMLQAAAGHGAVQAAVHNVPLSGTEQLAANTAIGNLLAKANGVVVTELLLPVALSSPSSSELDTRSPTTKRGLGEDVAAGGGERKPAASSEASPAGSRGQEEEGLQQTGGGDGGSALMAAAEAVPSKRSARLQARYQQQVLTDVPGFGARKKQGAAAAGKLPS